MGKGLGLPLVGIAIAGLGIWLWTTGSRILGLVLVIGGIVTIGKGR